MKRNVFKSTAAVLAGFVFIAVFCFLTDRALQWAGILPVPGKVKFDDEHALLALAYHVAYALLGSYLTAWLAPSRPMAHALTLGVILRFLFSARHDVVTALRPRSKTDPKTRS